MAMEPVYLRMLILTLLIALLVFSSPQRPRAEAESDLRSYATGLSMDVLPTIYNGMAFIGPNDANL
ncbi:hypothetical protein [Ktedonobacter racemifer]|uniref:Uncharacterized protein n=1 Tax=Ktedonobacter racemifer DSM 44963 TaxID=485913 RepID=D6U5L0_KTERA|nr:hypothetical protein [Ktedonobacter racemifer]EFH80271.1 hypothetical protein Krac_0857 [Ktedonobacter racemifer DSM 44963]